jgi:hypothetical protein
MISISFALERKTARSEPGTVDATSFVYLNAFLAKVMEPRALENSTVVLSHPLVFTFLLPGPDPACYCLSVNLSLLISKRGTSPMSMATTTIITTTIKTTGASGEGRNS